VIPTIVKTLLGQPALVFRRRIGIGTSSSQHDRNPRFAQIRRIVQAFTEADAGGNLGDCRTDGSIRHIAHDVATWNGIVKLNKDGSEKEKLVMDTIKARFDNPQPRDYVRR
jgi:hypothetical protein